MKSLPLFLFPSLSLSLFLSPVRSSAYSLLATSSLRNARHAAVRRVLLCTFYQS